MPTPIQIQRPSTHHVGLQVGDGGLPLTQARAMLHVTASGLTLLRCFRVRIEEVPTN